MKEISVGVEIFYALKEEYVILNDSLPEIHRTKGGGLTLLVRIS